MVMIGLFYKILLIRVYLNTSWTKFRALKCVGECTSSKLTTYSNYYCLELCVLPETQLNFKKKTGIAE